MQYFYRYEDTWGSEVIFAKINLRKYRGVRETPCGYWIQDIYRYWKKEKWISKDSRKRYAYPTKEEAFESFKKRKKSQIEILEHQLSHVKQISGMIEHYKIN